MPRNVDRENGTRAGRPDDPAARVEAYYRAQADVRRGICLLNAGQFNEAAEAFTRALKAGCADKSLPAYLAECARNLMGSPDTTNNRPTAPNTGTTEPADDGVPRRDIRAALQIAADGRSEAAVAALRELVTKYPECAEVHFQLGVQLAAMGHYEEAELRFGQVISLERNHVDAHVHLALCCGIRQAAREAVNHLIRAQALRPNDPRIGLLLTQAARTTRHLGQPVRIRAAMTDGANPVDGRAVEELAGMIEREPDLVDALLAIPESSPDKQVATVLSSAISQAMNRNPQRAELHLHQAQIVERLGRADQAIIEHERAVALNPTLTRSLVELGRLYQMTNRPDAAISTLNQAAAAGAKYADVYYRLGTLYRDRGDSRRARDAYEQALSINKRYTAAQTALATLES